jgi:hypothetical protein
MWMIVEARIQCGVDEDKRSVPTNTHTLRLVWIRGEC